MSFHVIQNNFSAGELSPFMHARSDVQRYFAGASCIENFIPLPQGGVTRRPGTKWITKAKVNSIQLIPFFVSRNVGYILEMGEGYCRIIDQATDDYVRVAGSPVEFSHPYTTSQLPTLRWAQSVDVLFIDHPSHPPASITRESSTSWVYAVETMQDGPYLDLETDSSLSITDYQARMRIRSTAADFSGASVGKYVEYTYQGKVAIGKITALISTTEVEINPFDEFVFDPYEVDEAAVIVYESGAPKRLTSNIAVWQRKHEYRYFRQETGIWYLTNFRDPGTDNVAPGGVFTAYEAATIRTNDAAAPDSSPLTMQATTGVISWHNRSITSKVTASAAVFNATTDHNRSIRINIDGHHNWGRIYEVISTTVVRVSWDHFIPPWRKDYSVLIGKGTTDSWRLGAWYVGNYPSQICFHQGRLVHATTAREPNVVWLSKTDDFTDFGPTNDEGQVLDTSAIRAVLNTPEFGAVQWLASHQTSLLLGGETHLWRIHYTGQAGSLTPTSIVASEEIEVRSNSARIAKSASNVIFVGNGTVNATAYEFDVNGYTAKDLTIASEHMTRCLGANISTVAVQTLDHDRVWVLGSGGVAAGVVGCLVWNPKEETQAWSRHWLGHRVTSLATLDDEVYFAVSRPWGTTIEKLFTVAKSATTHGDDDLPTKALPLGHADWRYVDNWKSFTGVDLTTVAVDPGHFPVGRTVQVVADGSWRDAAVVDGSGNVAVSGAPASHVVVGLISPATLVTMPLDAGAQDGTGQGRGVKVSEVVARVIDSYNFKHGGQGEYTPPTSINASQLDTLSMRDSDDSMDAVSLKTGDYKMITPASWSEKGQIRIVKDDPYPLTLLALILKGTLHSMRG